MNKTEDIYRKGYTPCNDYQRYIEKDVTFWNILPSITIEFIREEDGLLLAKIISFSWLCYAFVIINNKFK